MLDQLWRREEVRRTAAVMARCFDSPVPSGSLLAVLFSLPAGTTQRGERSDTAAALVFYAAIHSSLGSLPWNRGVDTRAWCAFPVYDGDLAPMES